MRRFNNVTINDLNNMTPEELEAYKQEAARRIFRRFVMLFLLKVGLNLLIARWTRKLRDS